MSVRGAALAAAAIMTVGGVAACGHAGPASSGPARASTTAVLDASGHAWATDAAGAVLVSTDAGRQWATVRLPGTPASGHSVTVSGRDIAAVTVTGAGLAYQRSVDGGSVWHTIAVPTATPTDEASVAVSSGGEVAVMATLPGSAGGGDTPELAVGPAAGPLRAVSAPVAGDVAWAGRDLVLTGGPLHDQLYVSRDDGAHWSQHAVGGPLAPRFNVAPTVAGFSTPVSAPDGSVTVPVTSNRDGQMVVRLYRSTSGASWSAGPRISMAGADGPGVTALVSPAGTGRFVVADPGHNTLRVVAGSSVTTVRPAGLTGIITSLTFASAQDGLAVTSQQTCQGKQDCRSVRSLYRTSDGGQHWRLASA